jgi:hypothetical protein
VLNKAAGTILPFFFPLREGRSLGVFENIMPREIFGSTRRDVREEWIKLHNEKINNFAKH